MRKIIGIAIIALLAGGLGSHVYFQHQKRGLVARLLTVEEQLSETKKDLVGYTRFTDYLAVIKTAISAQMQFLAAKVDRDYVQVEHIEKSKFGFKSDATIMVKYAVEYSVGYDLKPDSFTVSGDSNGITVTVHKPEVVATPAVKIISHEIPSTGVLIDEQSALLALEEQLHTVALNQAKEIANDEAVIALCEKKLRDFLHDFLARLPNVSIVPTITFAYK